MAPIDVCEDAVLILESDWMVMNEERGVFRVVWSLPSDCRKRSSQQLVQQAQRY